MWELAEKTGVIATPGEAFGKYGEEHFRLTIFQPKEMLEEAVERVQKFLQK
jgi:LL-diaminopimelate aminotransferase